VEKVMAAKQWQHHRQNGYSLDSKLTATTNKRKQQSTGSNGDGSDSM